jgi:putative phosphoesterase
MKIGLLSDTHSYLDPRVFDHFKNCNEVWHAGDIGDPSVARSLEEFKPFRAVYGNIDDRNICARFPEDLRFQCEEVRVWITHIGGVPPHYNSRVKKLLKENPPDIFICGHSHILRVGKDAAHHNLLYINPGAAGHQGFHAMRTMIRFDILGKEVKNMEVIELGKRGAISKDSSNL